jgi:hypothetical protein
MTEKRFIVKVRYGRGQEDYYPRLSVQERIFGSKPVKIVKGKINLLDGTTKQIALQGPPAVTLSSHDVIALLQLELKREWVDRVTIIAV